VKARFLWPVRAFRRLDFPTLLLPKKAISGSRSAGNLSGLPALTINSDVKRRSRRPTGGKTADATGLVRYAFFHGNFLPRGDPGGGGDGQ